MTYNSLLHSNKNRVKVVDTAITSHLGISVSSYTQLDSSVITFTPTSLANNIIYRLHFIFVLIKRLDQVVATVALILNCKLKVAEVFGQM